MQGLRQRIQRLQHSAGFDKTLFAGAEARPWRVLAARASLVLALFWGVILVLWLERDGIRDQIDGHTSFIDLLYFAVVSLTTVGYGDIVPVTERSRLIDTVLITPARLVVWLVFIGTAFDLFLHKGLERLRMARLQQQLKDHVVICGFGHSGRTAAAELVRRGVTASEVVVVDGSEQLLQEAAAAGHIGIKGDATMERVLRDAAVERAGAVIICTGRDDTNALAVLTVRQLNPRARVITNAHEEETRRCSGRPAPTSPSRRHRSRGSCWPTRSPTGTSTNSCSMPSARAAACC
jgi:voltage-gated potassium channel